MNALAPQATLDVTGTLCPLPVRLTARALAPLPPGARLEIVGDDPAMVIDLPAWCEESGHRLLALTRDDHRVRAVIERGPRGRSPRP
jgi:tRNA 2-thiouridine synthesizing protein A